jgi:hypothetical protein
MSDRLRIEQQLDEYVRLLDGALAFGKKAVEERADADEAYKVAHARAFVTAKAEGSTDALAKASADLATEGLRKRDNLADGMAQMALEAVRSRRTQVSAVQSKMRGFDAEAAYDRTGPR